MASVRSKSTRLLAIALITCLGARPVVSSPGDIQSVTAPTLGASAPKAKEVSDGDVSVSTSTGAASYQYPIRVPPGRQGMAPSLSLSYSSQNAIYGKLAAGWELGIPMITLDTSSSRLAFQPQEMETDPWADDRFVSMMSGGRPLIVVDEPKDPLAYRAYRAQNDSGYIRYQRMAAGSQYRWKALTPDGTTHYFGDQIQITNGTSTPTEKIMEDRAPLTRTVDPFGNTIRYLWSYNGIELRISRIEYTSNGSLPHFAEVRFSWEFPKPEDLCGGIPPGAQTTYRSGRYWGDGWSRLNGITAVALDSSQTVVHTREITLSYSTTTTQCNRLHAPFRQLVSISERAWGVDAPMVTLPPVTFEYGDATPTYTAPQNQPITWNGTSTEEANLQWGHRHEGDRWPSIEAMLIDFDGDARLDRLYALHTSNTECQVTWDRNTPTGFAPSNQVITLPRMRWATNDTMGPGEACTLTHQRTKRTNKPLGFCPPKENYLAYRWMDVDSDGLPDLVTAIHHDPLFYDPHHPTEPTPHGSPWPTCGSNIEPACAGMSEACMRPAISCTEADGICGANPSIVTGCLEQAPASPCFDAIFKQWPDNDMGCHDKSNWQCNAGELTEGDFIDAGCQRFLAPHLLRDTSLGYPGVECGGYPWVIHKNLGNGQLAPGVVKIQPTPLETDVGDSSLDGVSGFPSRWKGINDVDGDGAIDAIVVGALAPDPSEINSWPYWWFVFRGDESGGFEELGGTFQNDWRGYWFQAPDVSGLPNVDANRKMLNVLDDTSSPDSSPPQSLYATTTGQLTDVNGDGVPDYVRIMEDGSIRVYFNDGVKFRHTLQNLGEVVLAPPLTEITRSNIENTDSNPDPYIHGGMRKALTRPIDFDGDGRLDVFHHDSLTINWFHFNAGGQFLAPKAIGNGSTDPSPLALRNEILAHEGAEEPFFDRWETKTDARDIDGDGLLDLIVFNGSQMTVQRRVLDGRPPRLLTQIKNGRGLTSTIRYAPLSDPDFVDNNLDGAGTLSTPHGGRLGSSSTQWVVKTMTIHDDFESSDSTTTYRYFDPVHVADDKGRDAFRGFREVHVIGPRGSTAVSRYGYNPDWSGRLETSLVYPGAATPASPVHTIRTTTWNGFTLFGTIRTFHPIDARSRTCAPEQTEAACMASPAGFTRSQSTWTALTSTTSPGATLLHAETETTTQDSEAIDEEDRQKVSFFALNADATTYRLRLETTESRNGIGQLFAKSRTTWDPTFRAPILEDVFLDGDNTPQSVATTEKRFDMATGNLLQVRKPEQYADNVDRWKTLEYDAKSLFVVATVDEEGHRNETDYDYGTGVEIEKRGPNERGCDPNCPPDPPGDPLPVHEGSRTEIDGLGRPLAIDVTIAHALNALGTYKFQTVETFSYVDTATATMPTSVTHKKLVEYYEATNRWTETKTELDGRGRPIRSIEKVHGTAPADAVTTYDYDIDGKLVGVTVPDPSVNSSATVTFTYTFDTLERPTGMRRPDSVNPATRSGIDVAYEGLAEIRTEVTGAAGGQSAKTRLEDDVFGRLSTVSEYTSDTVYSLTSYEYSFRDEVKRIVDPEGVETLLEHDWAGRRMQITRGGGNRVWRYAYDRNGNMVSETTPLPTPTTDPILFTSFMAYDDLDRMTSKVIAPRLLSLDDRNLFGSNIVTFTWDGGVYNREARLSYASYDGPSGGTKTFSSDFTYDPEGNTAGDDRAWHEVGIASRGESYRWAPHQRRRYVFYPDGAGDGESPTKSTMHFDNRGNPLMLRLTRDGINTNRDVAVQTRNVAGLVTKRRTDQTGLAMTFVESLWTYDKLGRVTQQKVQKGPGNVTVAQQDLTYWGNDDPKTLDHRIGPSNLKHFDYQYDKRHQLVATDVNGGGVISFASDYVFGPAGRFVRTTVSASSLPGSDVRPRDVNYVYAAADPEQVSELRNASGPYINQPYARYTYDEAGNQVTRQYYVNGVPSPTEPWTFVYDGEDQLRRVIAPDLSREEYWYDHQGNRALIRKSPPAPASPTEYRWFHANTEIEFSPTLTPVRTWAYASMGTPVARIQDRNDRTELQFHGLANSTLATVESGVGEPEQGEPPAPASGTTNVAFIYGPFGEIVESAGTSDELTAHQRRQNNKYQDVSSGLGYYGARYYDSVLSVWTQSDPRYRFAPDSAWTMPRRGSLYSYSLNNALRYEDPDGLDPQLARLAVAMDRACNGCVVQHFRNVNEAAKKATITDVLKAGLTMAFIYTGAAAIAYRGLAGALAFARSAGPGGGVTVAGGAVTRGIANTSGGIAVVDDIATKMVESARGAGQPRLLGPGKWQAKEFKPTQLDKHFKKHSSEWSGNGTLSQKTYLKRAQDLLNTEPGGQILGHVRANGDVLRYNTRTNEFASAAQDGTIRTLFRPSAGREYWDAQVAQ